MSNRAQRRKWTISAMGLLLLGWGIGLGGIPARTTLAEAGDPSQPSGPPSVAPARTFHVAKHTPAPGSYVTDKEIAQAIEKAATHFIGLFDKGRLKDPSIDTPEGAGTDFLVVYALLQAGLSVDDQALAAKLDAKSPFMKELIDGMKSIEPTARLATYARGIRLTALSLINRPEDHGTVECDVYWLLDACVNGGYTYDINDRTGKRREKGYAHTKSFEGKIFGDNSNSQYGVLGIWSAAEIGAEIPGDYWVAVEKRWADDQMANGQWCYISALPGWNSVPTMSMTLAGMASLFVCHDYLDEAKFGDNVSREPFSPKLAKGLEFMEKGDNAVITQADRYMYCAYGLERVGLASGFKYFGTHDWYREEATKIVRKQEANGGFGTGPAYDAEGLLFLARGRHALLMNKLRYEHFWANRPRDMVNLCKFAGRELENVFNWQVVNLQHEWSDWLDAPILYIAGSEAPKFTDADFAKLRSYMEAGGLLFTHQDGNKSEFTDYVHNVMLRKICPDYEMTKVPDNHPFYTVYEQPKTRLPLEMVSNGARVMWVHSPRDIAAAWQQNSQLSKKDTFDTALNLFIYAAGKKDFLHRVDTNFIADAPAASPDNTIKVVRVKYPMVTWDPEPYAWKRFTNWLGWETSIGVSTQTVEMDNLGKLSPSEAPLAHLTGTSAYSVTEEQIQSLRQYVNAGGILFIDSCGGNRFNESIKRIVGVLAPEPAPMEAGHPMLHAGSAGMSDLGKLALRPYAQKLWGRNGGSLYDMKIGKGHVIYTMLDVTNALLGNRTWAIVGFDPPTAQQLLKNVLLWAATGAPENQ